MPYGIAFFAILLLVAGLRGTESDLGALLKGDFIGQRTFLPWMGSIIAVGALGYFAPLKRPVDLFLTLILIVLILDKNQGVFEQLSKAITATTSATSVGVNAADSVSPFGASGGTVSKGGTANTSGAKTASSGGGLSGGQQAADIGGGALTGAMAGAEAGSIFPGIGTAIGAVAGAAIGAGVAAGQDGSLG